MESVQEQWDKMMSRNPLGYSAHRQAEEEESDESLLDELANHLDAEEAQDTTPYKLEMMNHFNIIWAYRDMGNYTWYPNKLYNRLSATKMGKERLLLDALWVEMTKHYSLTINVTIKQLHYQTSIATNKIYGYLSKLKDMGIIESIVKAKEWTITLNKDYLNWNLAPGLPENTNLADWIEQSKTKTKYGYIRKPLELITLQTGIKNDSLRRLFDYCYYRTFGYTEIKLSFIVQASTLSKNTSIPKDHLAREIQKFRELGIFEVKYIRAVKNGEVKHYYKFNLVRWIYFWNIPDKIKSRAYDFYKTKRDFEKIKKSKPRIYQTQKQRHY